MMSRWYPTALAMVGFRAWQEGRSDVAVMPAAGPGLDLAWPWLGLGLDLAWTWPDPGVPPRYGGF